MLTSEAVMTHLRAALPDAVVVCTNGYPSRELYNCADDPGNFYLLGSMGMAAPIAYGIAAARPGHTVVAIDGDGSLTMNLGCLTLAQETRASVVHVVLDNGMHQSTGGQRTMLPRDLTAVATATGYRTAVTVRDDADLAGLDFSELPMLIHAVVAPRTGGIGKRVRHTPQEIVSRTQDFLDRVPSA